jgi:uncharacterized protein
LHIAKTHITKATVNPYYGQEIPRSIELGLEPTRIYYLLRDPAELAKAASTFERIQILQGHKPILNTEQPDELKEIIVGSIGSEVHFNFPYLDADVCVWDKEAIAGIETKTVHEWSCCYRYTAVMTPGVFEGQRYDGIMTDIRADHLALVQDGRAGSDVVAADEAIKTMAKATTKLGKALIVTLGGMSPKLAQDSALISLVGQAKKKTLNKGDLSAKLVALDAELDSTKIESAIDALVALDAEPEEKKEKKVAEDDDEDDDDTAMDEDEKEEEKKKKVAEDNMKTAMDSFKRELRETEEARRAVRLVVGDVLAQDSAEGIYAFALDHLKVGHEGVTGVPALKALFSVAQPSQAPVTPRVALDSAGLVSRFPNAARFRQQ